MAIQTPIRGLRSFCVAAKCLSFKHAAQQLHITPSAVSHQIKQLEEQLDKQLFKRQTRAIELTDIGREFYQALAPIIDQLETTINEFTHNIAPQTITITLPEFFASELVVPALHDWSEQHPSINLHLETIKSHSQATKKTDLSVVLSGSKPSDAMVYELFPIRYIAACNKSLYKKIKDQGFNAISQNTLIVHKARPWAWHSWANEMDIDQFDPQRIMQLDSMFSMLRAAQKGLGIALVPMPMAQSWFEESTLIQLFEHELVTKDKYYLIQHDWHNSRPDINVFVQWLLTKFSQR